MLTCEHLLLSNGRWPPRGGLTASLYSSTVLRYQKNPLGEAGDTISGDFPSILFRGILSHCKFALPETAFARHVLIGQDMAGGIGG